MAFGSIMKLTVGDLQIELAPLTKEVMGDFISAENNGGMQQYEVHRYLGRNTAPVLEDECEWYERVRSEKDSLLWGIWVVEGTSRKLIGNTAIIKIGQVGSAKFIRRATAGSMIFNQEYWGKGIAGAIHKARTWFAFKYLGIHQLASEVLQPNVGSRKALEKAGYTHVFTERNETYTGGELLHLDHLECLNPLDLFWSTWWHGDRPTKAAREARQRTLEVMAWAEENVTL